MEIERNPVPGSDPPLPLRCKDFDPITDKRIGFACENEQKAHPEGRFDCTNHGIGPKSCNRRTFLYPRKRNDEGKFHTHQGIDFFPAPLKPGETPKPVPILAVTAGEVCCVLEWDGVSSGYGNVIAIYDATRDMTFWYAHCTTVLFKKHQKVLERQEIATVGNTGRAGGPHLHFEVHRGRSNGPVRGERTVFDASGPRLDPHEVLESLGPWGMSQLFHPRGAKVTQDEVRDLHAEIESSREGGCFPLGANNLWHGGVHLRMPPGAELHAPFGGEIVALRLDPDPAQAITPLGSSNFVLLRHEISLPIFDRLQSELRPGAPPPVTPKPAAPAAVGRHSSNLPDDVLAVKQALHERLDAGGRPFYDPTSTLALTDGDRVDSELLAAIETFQRTLDNPFKKHPERWPDGQITVGGHTWMKLFPTGPAGPVDPTVPTSPTIDPKRTVYSLFMHVGAAPLDAKLAAKVKWLNTATSPSSPKPTPTKDDDEKARTAHAADVEEGKRVLTGFVGRKPDDPASPGAPADIEWVQRRLARHTDYAFDVAKQAGVFDDALDRAIRDFQEAFVPHFVDHGRKGDGLVDAGKTTYETLATPARELRAGGSASTIDPALRARLEARGPDGRTGVVSGLSIPVAGNDVLWVAGKAQVVKADGSGSLESLVHWEIFSETSLVAAWEAAALRDENDDLTLDVPERIFDAVELSDLPGFARDDFITALEMVEFYASERSMFLRRTPCLFRSEWGMDLGVAIPSMAKMSIDTTGLAETLAPMMWWNDATDVLPASPKVWHYNPIEFVGLYQAHVDALTPKAIDTSTQGTLVVRVRFDNGVLRPKAGVFLARDGVQVAAERTFDDGEAWFRGIEPGEYTVWVDQGTRTFYPARVSVGDPCELEVTTTVAGPPPPRGTIKVTIRRYDGHRVEDGIEVELSPTGAGDRLVELTRKGTVHFESVLHGEYTVTTPGIDPVVVELDRKKLTVPVIVLPPRLGMLTVRVIVDGSPVANYAVTIRKNKTVVAGPRPTDHSGGAHFELPAGHYQAHMGDLRRGVRVMENETQEFSFRLRGKDDPGPEPEEESGTIAVTVVDHDGAPARNELVFVSDPQDVVEAAYPDEHGVATFELPPNHYTVTLDEQAREVDLEAWAMEMLRFVVRRGES